ncbi:MAG: ThuA domain-containing protein, partial [Verrucomicrobiota bacterium]
MKTFLLKNSGRILFLIFLGVTTVFGIAGEKTQPKRILFYSKAASWEQKIVHREFDQPSYIELLVQKLGRENNLEIVLAKDGSIFTPEKIAGFDGFLFFTSGDPTFQERHGRGDNYPLMSLEGKKAFLDAIKNGKGFVGCNTANYTFPDPLSRGEKDVPSRYTKMLGAAFMGHNAGQKGHFSYLDSKFPGMEKVPSDYSPDDQWYAFKELAPDMHVIMAIDSPKLVGNLYARPPYPVAWARMEEKGRVFYTTMGHSKETWTDPVFVQMLLGGIKWSVGLVDADVSPNKKIVTPEADVIPESASKFVAGDPPVDNPQFPNFKENPKYKIHMKVSPTFGDSSRKNILFYSKSAGDEMLISYRSGAYVSEVEEEMVKFGEANHLNIYFVKDGGQFAPENISKYDAFIFYTCGDLLDKTRRGPGDNYPMMTPEQKEGFLKAVRDGKGFIGIHQAIDTFVTPAVRNE